MLAPPTRCRNSRLTRKANSSTRLPGCSGVRRAHFGKTPAIEAVSRIERLVVERLAADGFYQQHAARSRLSPTRMLTSPLTDRPTRDPAAAILAAVVGEGERRWRELVKRFDAELFAWGTDAFTWLAIEELARSADRANLLADASRGRETRRFAHAVVKAQLGRVSDATTRAPFADLTESLTGSFRSSVLFWKRQGGPKGDLVDDEFGRVLQVPGWSNIFTQPIINRIEMLSTGVRTDIGIKVFGPDLDTVVTVCRKIESEVKSVAGARDVVAAPIMGKGYLRSPSTKRARLRHLGRDVQTEIEMGAGRPGGHLVEDRDRLPIAQRACIAKTSAGAAARQGERRHAHNPKDESRRAGQSAGRSRRTRRARHAARDTRLIPLSRADVASSKAAMIRSENAAAQSAQLAGARRRLRRGGQTRVAQRVLFRRPR